MKKKQKIVKVAQEYSGVYMFFSQILNLFHSAYTARVSDTITRHSKHESFVTKTQDDRIVRIWTWVNDGVRYKVSVHEDKTIVKRIINGNKNVITLISDSVKKIRDLLEKMWPVPSQLTGSVPLVPFFHDQGLDRFFEDAMSCFKTETDVEKESTSVDLRLKESQAARNDLIELLDNILCPQETK